MIEKTQAAKPAKKEVKKVVAPVKETVEATKKKVRKAKKEDIFVDDKLPFFKFTLQEMKVNTVNEVSRRTCIFVIDECFESAARKYNVVMVFDAAELDEQLRKVRDEKVQYESQAQSQLQDIREDQLNRFDEIMKRIKEQREDAEKSCPKITFKMRVLKPDLTSSNYTKLLCKIPKNVAKLFIDMWDEIGSYKIQLQEV